MKTINLIEKEISELKLQIADIEKTKQKKDLAAGKRLRTKFPKLKEALFFIKSSPSKEFLDREVARLTNRINEILKMYALPENAEYLKKSQLSKMKKDFETKWEIPKIRKQISGINYILR